MRELFSGPSGYVVMTLGTACVLCWLVAYVGIIRRGFLDKTFGMPVAALAANISWEASYAFFYQPFGDYLHNLCIAWFVLDVPIAVQCFLYGAEDFSAPFVRRHFKLLFAASLVIAFPLVLAGFYEFHDPAGEYTGFGINFLMSLLFVAMLVRRDGVGGQSMYIALFKWLGTLLSFVATALDAMTDRAHPWPASLRSFLFELVTHNAYPLTFLIKYLYLVIFCADLLYLVLLHRKLKESGIKPWARF